MEKIEWNSSFSVGVALLDEQHKQLIRMANRLLAESEASVRSERISELLGEMTKYAVDHFMTEEELMAHHGYPELSSHKEEHKTFRLKVVALCQETMYHNASVPEELLRYLGEWWVNHILTVDMKCRPFFMERGIKWSGRTVITNLQ